MLELLHKYNNGNAKIKIYSDGTRIIKTKGKEVFSPNFPVSIDMKITNYCDEGCVYCHENSTNKGRHGNIDISLINSLKKGTEVAIGGGNPLSHPRLIELLTSLEKQGVLASMTVNQKSLNKKDELDLLNFLLKEKLLFGLGVSLDTVNDELIEFLQKNKNSVLHIIIGVTPYEEIKKLFQKGIKILFLGFKECTGRGVSYYSHFYQDIEKTKKEIQNNIIELIQEFNTISFDNKAIEQLDMKNKISKSCWEHFYQGDDGDSTMYVDIVKGEFAKSSVANVRYSIDGKNIIEVFDIVKSEKLKKGNNIWKTKEKL